MARPPPLALRVSLVQRGRLLEERLLRPVAPVTVGAAAGNTFARAGDGVPEAFTLFPVRRGAFALALDAPVRGRLHGKGGAADLGALSAARPAAGRGGVQAVPLAEGAWGKAVLGDLTVVFEVVAAPPEPRAPSLPAPARGHRFRSMDGVFVAVLAVSLAAHVTAFAALSRVPAREEVTLEEIPDRFVKLLVPERAAPARRELEKPKVAEAPEPAPAPRDEPPAPGGTDAAAAPARDPARAAAAARAVASKGLLRVLGSLGGAARPKAAVAGVLGEGGGFGEVAAALASTRPAAAAAVVPEAAPRRSSAGPAAPARIGDLATGGGAGAALALGTRREVQVKGAVSAEAAEVDSPELDQTRLGQFVRARIGALQACYEAQLKRNPALRGRIRVRFTVLETGALADVAAADDALGSPELAACIVATVSAWRTPFRPRGPVTVEYPLVFSAS